MVALAGLFDRWVGTGPFRAVDVATYRIIFAGVLLVGLPDLRWVSAYPDSLFHAPPGPFQIFDGFPPEKFFAGLQVALAVAVASLLVGLFTRMASWAVALLLCTGSGFAYSLGKIDHTIFLVLTPVVLSFTGWGDRLSLDALRHQRRQSNEMSDDAMAPQWPMRLLALLVSAGFLTAAMPKVLAGWLDPATQATRETMLRQYYVNGRTELLAGQAVHLPSVAFWEFLDWSTVLLEASVILAVLGWTTFRLALSALALFHVGVLLTMNISFAGNVLIYAAFLPWGCIGVQRLATRAPLRWHWAWVAVPLALGVLAVIANRQLGTAGAVTGPVLLWGGAALAVTYAGVTAWRLVGRRRPSTSIVDLTRIRAAEGLPVLAGRRR